MIRIATRKSPLALAQAQRVADALKVHGHASTLVPMQTPADQRLDQSLVATGEIKGLFTKTLTGLA